MARTAADFVNLPEDRRHAEYVDLTARKEALAKKIEANNAKRVEADTANDAARSKLHDLNREHETLDGEYHQVIGELAAIRAALGGVVPSAPAEAKGAIPSAKAPPPAPAPARVPTPVNDGEDA